MDNLVVVGASAGGVEALLTLVAGFPPDLDAAVLVVLHTPANAHSRLPDLLARAGRLPASAAVDGAPLRSGQVLTAPPDRHLLVHGSTVMLSTGPRENGHRPAVDALFRSAARYPGPRTVAVVLSGSLDDGAAGAAAVAARGGRVLVQDPAEALFAGMPRHTRAAVPDAPSLPVADLAAALPQVLAGLGTDARAPSPDLVLETDMAEMDDDAVSGVDTPGTPTTVSCPECRGVMREVRTMDHLHYRCHVGHAYGLASLLDAQERTAEAATWAAVASLEEQAALHERVASAVQDGSGEEHRRRAEAARTRARGLRRHLRAQS